MSYIETDCSTYLCSKQSEHKVFGPTVPDIWLSAGRIHFEIFGDFAKVTTREIKSRNLLTKKTRQKSVASYCTQRTDSARLGSIRSHSGVVSSHLILPPQQTTNTHDLEREFTRSLTPTELYATHQLFTARDSMDTTRRTKLIKQRSVARGMLSRIENFNEAGDQKINDIQVRFDKLPDIFNRYDIAQSELELSDDTDHPGDTELFENQYYQVEAKFSKFYIL